MRKLAVGAALVCLCSAVLAHPPGNSHKHGAGPGVPGTPGPRDPAGPSATLPGQIGSAGPQFAKGQLDLDGNTDLKGVDKKLILGKDADKKAGGDGDKNSASVTADNDDPAKADKSHGKSPHCQWVSGAEHALQARLADIDRMRDKALETGDARLLAEADKLEAEARGHYATQCSNHGQTTAALKHKKHCPGDPPDPPPPLPLPPSPPPLIEPPIVLPRDPAVICHLFQAAFVSY
jgi:hypothetical protein